MEIKLTDNSRRRLDWPRGGSLYVQLSRSATLNDGHRLLLTGTAVLSDNELTAFLAEASKTQDPQEVRL